MDPYFLRHNERVKLAALTAAASGTALLGYSLGKISDGNQDMITSFSVFGAFLLFYAAFVALGELLVEQ